MRRLTEFSHGPLVATTTIRLRETSGRLLPRTSNGCAQSRKLTCVRARACVCVRAADLRATSSAQGPVIWPGFSWSNLKPGATFNEIPRFGGAFFQQQADAMLRLNSTYVFIAQFDEVNEGTAMFKAVSSKRDTPVEARFLYLGVDGDAVPTDHYLSLAGNFTHKFSQQQ